MDPLTAVAVWGVSIAGIAALVRAATRAGLSTTGEGDFEED